MPRMGLVLIVETGYRTPRIICVRLHTDVFQAYSSRILPIPVIWHEFLLSNAYGYCLLLCSI